MDTTNANIKKSWKRIFRSVDDIFIILGILLNAFSLIFSFVYGHLIAGIILLVCEIILIGIYIMKMI
ncbi:MAG: hypothetical protein HGN29_10845 [Asgard group archaeon]|nr:hypothetical protein [Asgard group archaeon]